MMDYSKALAKIIRNREGLDMSHKKQSWHENKLTLSAVVLTIGIILGYAGRGVWVNNNVSIAPEEKILGIDWNENFKPAFLIKKNVGWQQGMRVDKDGFVTYNGRKQKVRAGDLVLKNPHSGYMYNIDSSEVEGWGTVRPLED